jgi:UDP-N-acetylmuramoyl-L-alanyl-D-glutamate--2,6-diaminopimelate ligase
MRHVSELFAVYAPLSVSPDGENLTITGLSLDSRKIMPGMMFFAIHGTTLNGEDYIPQAIANGAVAIVCQQGRGALVPKDITVIEVKDVRLAAAKYAAAFYQPQPEHVVLITGTDGKTSTAIFCRQLWEGLGLKAASLGTIGLETNADLPDSAYEALNTTPDPIVLHQRLNMLAKAGVEHVAIEASSHGLDQRRLEGVVPSAAVFTSFGEDHLDYHGTLENYFAAKARLFTELLPAQAVAVLNADNPLINDLSKQIDTEASDIYMFGRQGSTIQLLDVQPNESGQHVSLQMFSESCEAQLPLFGIFQTMNIMAALGAVHATVKDTPVHSLLELLPQLKSVPGRLELAGHHAWSNAPVFIDYAHTAQALEGVLQALRPHCENKLQVVFGCGGDRDSGKREAMGKVAAELADRVIVTDDNPRHEAPADIRQAIVKGCPEAQEIADRAEAIRQAIDDLQEGDVLLIAGKGHETYQIIGDEQQHFSDAEEVYAALAVLADMQGVDA